jgi:DNA-binding beta-propeller fold protein YncE
MKFSPKLSILIILLLFFLIGTILSACAPARWQPISTKTIEIFWPSPPENTRVHYLGEITRFEQIGGVLSTFIGKSSMGNIIKPMAITVGSGGRMAIADHGNTGIHLYIPDQQKYRFIFKADGHKISSPVGLTFDSANRLYATDSQLKKILVFDENGEYLFSITQAGQEPLDRPTGIIYNKFDKRLYVADSLKHQILIFNLQGEMLGKISSRGEKAGTLNFPTHLGVDYDGNVYITDSMNFRTQIFSPVSGKWRTFGRHGNGNGDFASPKGIGVDSNSIIYVAEALFDSVQLFDNQGTFLLTIGSQGNGSGEFWMPSGIFVDSTDRLYVCDTYNNRIQYFQLSTEPLPATPLQETL